MTPSSVTHLKSRARGISLGLYAADFSDLGTAVERAKDWGCSILHFDEMDGNFVPAMIGGPGIVGSVGEGMLRDVHLMVSHPSHHVEAYVKAGADIITVHAEAQGAAEAITGIREAATGAGRAVLTGLGLMPGTSLDQISELLALGPEMILVLSLDPRDGAPANITKATERLKEMRRRLPDALLAFDGGVTENTIDEIATARPDMIVSGSAVIKAADPAGTFHNMQAAWRDAVPETD
ncbi:MAG: ribulose phosphate epimerase [Rhodobacteraceae bacterium]|nr:ribulose phosphate epimerase [Paracoccaceae bacterium]